MDFRALVQKRYKEEDMSMRELAKRVETSASYLSRIFAGERTISLELAYKLANALNISVTVVEQEYRVANYAARVDESAAADRESVAMAAISKQVRALKKSVNPLVEAARVVDALAKVADSCYILALADAPSYVAAYYVPEFSRALIDEYLSTFGIDDYVIVRSIVDWSNLDVHDFEYVKRLAESELENGEDLLRRLETYAD